jgi:hypothetical protein
MKNPHIIIGEPRMCCCGVYDGKAVGCHGLIATMNKIKAVDDSTTIEEIRSIINEAKHLVTVVESVIEDCD